MFSNPDYLFVTWPKLLVSDSELFSWGGWGDIVPLADQQLFPAAKYRCYKFHLQSTLKTNNPDSKVCR